MKNTLLIATLSLALAFPAFARGRIQNEDVKSLSELTTAGGVVSQLINTDKIYDVNNTQQLSASIANGQLGGGGGGGAVNLLRSPDNPGFELGTTGWVASGGSFTLDTSTPLFGAKSALFDASGSGQTLRSSARPIVAGLQGQPCAALIGFKYASGADGDYVLEVWNGSAVISQITPLKVDTTGATQTAVATFACPASGTVAVEIKSTVANPPVIEIDGSKQNSGTILLGNNILLGDFGTASFYGSFTYPKLDTCFWDVTQTTYSADFPASTCNAPVVTGGLSAPAVTGTPQWRMLGAPAGTYSFTAPLSAESANHSGCRIIDELSNVVAEDYALQTNTTAFTLHGTVSYTTAGDHTYKVQCVSKTGVFRLRNYAVDYNSFTVHVYRYPNKTEQTIGGLDTTGQSYTGYIDSCSSAPNTTSSPWADFSNPGGCTLHQLNNTNMGTVTTSTGTNLTFTPRAIGTKYRVCVQATVGVTTSDHPLLRLIEVGGTSQDLFEQSSGSPGAAGFGYGCGIYTTTTISPVTLKLQGAVAGGTFNLDNFTTAGPLRGIIQWEILDISQSFPMIALVPEVNSGIYVTTPSGHGSGGTKVRKYSVVQENAGSAVTYTSDSTNGDFFTINQSGIYSMVACDYYSASDSHVGITKNAASLTTNIELQPAGQFLVEASTSPANQACAPSTLRLAAGDIIRIMDDGTNNCTDLTCNFRITQVAR